MRLFGLKCRIKTVINVLKRPRLPYRTTSNDKTWVVCVYGIVDSFKDILVIIYSISYRIKT